LLSDSANCTGNWTTRGYANSRITNSRTGHLADWSTRGLDNSRTSQLATGKLSTQSRRWHPRAVQCATCPVRELSSPRVGVSASCPVTIDDSRLDPRAQFEGLGNTDKQKDTDLRTEYEAVRQPVITATSDSLCKCKICPIM